MCAADEMEILGTATAKGADRRIQDDHIIQASVLIIIADFALIVP